MNTQQPMLLVHILDRGGKVVRTVQIPDPRVAFIERFNQQHPGRELQARVETERGEL